MKKHLGTLSLVMVAGLAMPAFAQDSVSANFDGGNGLPGDALKANVAGAANQQSAYVVHLSHFYSSWSHDFGVAPIIKSTRTGSTFFNNLTSSNALSQTMTQASGFASPSYLTWSTAGGGVNATQNDSSAFAVSPTGSNLQFGVAVTDFGTDDLAQSEVTVVTGIVNFLACTPDTLYVTRTVAATNIPATNGGGTASLGLGTVDAFGNVYFRADNNAQTGANKITGNNIFRVRSVTNNGFPGRDLSKLNWIDKFGGNDANATDWILKNSSTTHNTPASIPAGLNGSSARGTYIGSNFGTTTVGGKYLFESSALTTTSSSAHLVAPANDHRGATTFSPLKLRGSNTVGSGALLGKNVIENGTTTPTENILLWGLGTNGSVVNPVIFPTPRSSGGTINDPVGRFDDSSGNIVSYDWSYDLGTLRGYNGRTAFSGGNGPVAVGQDQAGRGLVASVCNSGLLDGAGSPYDAILVCRFDPNNPSNYKWVVAAWADPNNAFTWAGGKPILGDYGNDGYIYTGDAGEFDGVIDTNPLSPTWDKPIGRLAPLNEVGIGLTGPGISSPAFDSVGNLYFIAEVALYKQDANGNPYIDYDPALIRGVYNPDNFSYSLELLFDVGTTFKGRDSNTRYQIRFMNLAASSNTPSPASFWSDSVMPAAFGGQSTAGLATSDPQTLGGLIVNATIVYDTNDDHNYSDPTSATGDPTSPDEAYSVVLYVGYTPKYCRPDFNGDQFVDIYDFTDFVTCFEGGECPCGKTADYNYDGFADIYDFTDFVTDFELGC